MADGATLPFRRAVRAEARATWWGRRRWLWIAAAAVIAIWLPFATTREAALDSAAFSVLCGLTCWLPAILGADLLSLRFAGNPEPHREWAPREFLARALGRLLPLLLVELVWVGTFTALAVSAAGTPGTGLLAHPESAGPADYAGLWTAWTGVFLISGLPYFTGAALLSAAARRPRRWLIAPFVVIVASHVLTLLVRAAGEWTPFLRPPGIASIEDVWSALTLPGFELGYHSALLLDQRISVATLIGGDGSLETLCRVASVAFLLYTLPLAAGVWIVARRRSRRHPSSAAAEGCARQPEPAA